MFKLHSSSEVIGQAFSSLMTLTASFASDDYQQDFIKRITWNVRFCCLCCSGGCRRCLRSWCFAKCSEKFFVLFIHWIRCWFRWLNWRFKSNIKNLFAGVKDLLKKKTPQKNNRIIDELRLNSKKVLKRRKVNQIIFRNIFGWSSKTGFLVVVLYFFLIKENFW